VAALAAGGLQERIWMSNAIDPSLDLYQRLYRARRAEEIIAKYYGEDGMKTPMHMSLGQEAIPVGVCAALGAKGQVFSSYRSHASYIARTNETDLFFAELYGKATGGAQGKAGSMHLSAPHLGHMGSSAIVASQVPVAVGAAFANKVKGNGVVVAVFFGDGALDEGVLWESLNVAALMKLPVLFVCEDNGWAVHTAKAARHGYRSAAGLVAKYDCNVFEADGADVEKVRAVANEAITAIRETRAPSFTIFKCYRYLEHVGVNKDFDASYRPESEFTEWYARDPVQSQRARLLAAGHPERAVAQLERRIDAEIEESVARAKAAPFPATEELHRGVLA
jgi:TPP-dependent pyruvate/acetoin dehydrogenase alpha subunit